MKIYDVLSDPKRFSLSISNRLKWSLFTINRKFGSSPINPQDTILLTGSPRSGTTWLGNVLSASPDYMMVSEPFSLDQRLKSMGFTWRTFKNPDEEWLNGVEHITDMVQGIGLIPASFQDAAWTKCLANPQLILKCVRVNRLLPWMCKHISIKKYIYLIRHPCSVIASQIQHPAFQRLPSISDHNKTLLTTFFANIFDDVKSLSEEEELRAVEWCLDQYIPLKFLKKGDVVTIHYEELVQNGPDAIAHLFRNLNLVIPEKIDELWSKNSRERHGWSADHGAGASEHRLGNWKRLLTRNQIRKILNVVELFNINGFTESVTPEFDKIGID